ncbi:MAG: NAD(P)H-hydrate dehydratase [Candidatus Aenigmatarchaeota archaeon]|nr:NAD(P)H-hydrate dehydratase [Nanoarchaeota archaeon]
MWIVTKSILKHVYMKRQSWSHKGNHGHVAVIGGSKRYSGAPGLAALSSLRAGADLATVIAPKRAADIVAAFSPDLITYPLTGNFITRAHLREVLEITKNVDAVVIGSGLGRNKQSLDFVLQFLQKTNIPCVIDADAIYAFMKNTELLKENHIITPHAYEFEVLSDHIPDNNIINRTKLVHMFTSKHRTTVLLKGHVDVISNGINIAVNKTGTPYMTVGGTGDVLAGICGALLALGNKPFESACAGAYINGQVGNRLSKEIGPSLTATDLISNIYKVLR